MAQKLRQQYSLDDSANRSTPKIKIDKVVDRKPRSNSLGGDSLTAGIRDRSPSNKLLKGALLHNLLHPIDYCERKIRSRSNSCSSDINEEELSKGEIKKSRSRPSSPKPSKDGWPSYKPKLQERMTRRLVGEQLSCPPTLSVPQNIQRPASPGAHAKEFFAEAISNPVARYKDGHRLENPNTRQAKTLSESSSFSSYSSDTYSSYTSSSEDEDETDRPKNTKNQLSIPHPDNIALPGTSPTSRILNLISTGVHAIKKSRSNSNVPPKPHDKEWDEDAVHNRHVKDVLHLFSKSPTKEPPKMSESSSVEKLYSIYDQIIKEGQLMRRHSMEPERRRTPSGGTYVRGEDPNQAAATFRDSRGLPVAAPFLDNFSKDYLEQNQSQILVKFFKYHRTYDLIPTSAKLVIFDTRLQVKKAFYALVHNGVRAAPLWDSSRQCFVGMLTITDFIRILQRFYHMGHNMEELEDHRLEYWRSLLHDDTRELVRISPDQSLFDAIDMLISHKIHRLPVIDDKTGNVLYIITHKRILKFLYLYMKELPKPKILNKTLGEVRIGTFDNIQTATENTLLIEALDKFVDHRVSALPIIDNEGRLKDIYAKFDAINLAAKGTYNNLNVTLKEANEYRNEWFEGVQHCKLSETLSVIMERIVKAEVHRLVVVDENTKVMGVVSLSDLLKELVLKPASEDQTVNAELILNTVEPKSLTSDEIDCEPNITKPHPFDIPVRTMIPDEVN